MEDLTPAQQKELHQDLLALRESLVGALQKSVEESKPVDLDLPIGRLSRMDAIQQQNMAKANRRSIELRQKQIQTALAALQNDDYGYCRRCDEAIGYGRLKARPETPFCLDCQQQSERKR